MVDHAAFEPFNLQGFFPMSWVSGLQLVWGEEERKFICVCNRQRVSKGKGGMSMCVRVGGISRPHQSLMALCRDTGAENYLMCWAALLQWRSVLF